MYLTNQQAWNEVTKSFRENERRTKICIELFGQENLIGLSDEQRELYFNSIQSITMQFTLKKEQELINNLIIIIYEQI